MFLAFSGQLSAVSFDTLTPDRCLFHAPGAKNGLHVFLNLLTVLPALAFLFC
jgi:hypothetical protein